MNVRDSKTDRHNAHIELPFGHRLLTDRVHEITGPARDGWVLSILSLTSGPIIWIGRPKDVYSICAPAAASYFDPARLVVTECISRQEILWSTEQALRSNGPNIVVTELAQGPNLKESRRFQLAAEEGRTLGLLQIKNFAQTSASQTRWWCEAIASGTTNMNHRAWNISLIKNKGGQTGQWQVIWKEGLHATRHVHMVSTASS